MLNWLKGAVVVGAVVSVGLPVSAQVCTPLRVVEGAGTVVQKKVSGPSTPVSPSNWNTDFAVPGGQSYSRYVARVVTKNKGNYKIQMFLKYANKTADKVYDQTVSRPDNGALNISGSPRLNTDPYQVNLSIGGVRVVGNAYSVSVSGCK